MDGISAEGHASSDRRGQRIVTRSTLPVPWTTRLTVVASACLIALCVGSVTPAVATDMRSRQWYLDAMQAERMWETSTGEGVTVAVIDSGVDSSVPELQGQLLPGTDFSDDHRGANYDGEGHGTSMAMIIAG